MRAALAVTTALGVGLPTSVKDGVGEAESLPFRGEATAPGEQAAIDSASTEIHTTSRWTVRVWDAFVSIGSLRLRERPVRRSRLVGIMVW